MSLTPAGVESLENGLGMVHCIGAVNTWVKHETLMWRMKEWGWIDILLWVDLLSFVVKQLVHKEEGSFPGFVLLWLQEVLDGLECQSWAQ